MSGLISLLIGFLTASSRKYPTILTVTVYSEIAPRLIGLTIVTSRSVFPSMFFALRPIATTSPVCLRTATTEGSSTTIPFLSTQILIFEEPMSTAMFCLNAPIKSPSQVPDEYRNILTQPWKRFKPRENNSKQFKTNSPSQGRFRLKPVPRPLPARPESVPNASVSAGFSYRFMVEYIKHF